MDNSQVTHNRPIWQHRPTTTNPRPTLPQHTTGKRIRNSTQHPSDRNQMTLTTKGATHHMTRKTSRNHFSSRQARRKDHLYLTPNPKAELKDTHHVFLKDTRASGVTGMMRANFRKKTFTGNWHEVPDRGRVIFPSLPRMCRLTRRDIRGHTHDPGWKFFKDVLSTGSSLSNTTGSSRSADEIVHLSR